MPGPAHSGLISIESWRPGPGSAGARQEVQLGGYSTDVVLVRVLRDSESSVSSMASSTCTLRLQHVRGGSAVATYDVFRAPCSSVLFDPVLPLLDCLGVLVPAGAKVSFQVEHQGTDTVNWLFFFALP